MTQETNDVVTQELIERLNAWTTFDDADSLLTEAANALQSQSARIAELDAECERAWAAYRMAHDQAMSNGQALADLRARSQSTPDILRSDD